MRKLFKCYSTNENVAMSLKSPLPLKTRTILNDDRDYIIILEDNWITGLVIKKMCIKLRYTPILISKSNDLLPTIFRFKLKYEKSNKNLIILLDNHLGDKEVLFGSHICGLISQLEFVRVIGMSSNSLKDEYIQNGAIDFLQKVFTEDEFRTCLIRNGLYLLNKD